MLLPAEELADMRAVQVEAQPEWATIADRTETADALGGSTEAYVNRPTPVPCRVGLLNDRDVRVLGDRYNGAVQATITMPWDTAIKERDRVTVAGKPYYVVHAPPVGSWGTARRLLVTE